ncbi:unnamed protein product, partial [Brassica oleracea]
FFFCSDENFDVLRAEAILDEDHYGLADIKERILEFIAVRTLTGNPEVKIICLSGPPGVGKTSIARSIARVLDRKFFRLAVGGLSDSSEIKGDRGVCVGAKPGKMVQCLKQVGTENPLVLLDEIDKIGKSSKYDPEGALLELLDPEQNAQFLDYFLDVPIDLSKILFVCTANDIDRLPDPLLDRMEVIKLAGYTTDEKMHIARDYLVKIVSGKCGIKPDQVDVSDTALLSLIENYCREAGVRNLQKHIENIFRKEEYGSAEYVKKNRLSDTFRKRIEPIKEKVPKHVLEVIEEELANLDRKEADYGSTNRIYSYLDWLTALPWGKCSDENFDVLRAEKILDEDHYGLRVVKERILEFIAVGNLTGNPEGRKIICLSGPPGVGKTSIARSVARALGRKFFRLAVGGLSDSSEIKLGKSRRDPEGAFLELLDPEQNAHFLDHFLDVPIDLSKVLFVCTANNIDRLPASAKAAMVDLDSSETAAEGSIELKNEYLRLADVLKVFEHAVDGGSTRVESREVAEKFTVDESNLSDYVGATPKDGPSAGCTMITSLLSLAMKKPIRKDLAMTGEVTLTGRILPIGGLKEKTMAARRSQVKVIIFPEANRRDFEGLEESVKERLDVHFVDEYEQIFELAFGDDH